MNTELVLITPQALTALIESAVARVLDAQQPVSDWTDQEGIAQHLGVCSPTVRKLADVDGMPHVHVGAHKRFSRREVDAWLRARGAGPSTG